MFEWVQPQFYRRGEIQFLDASLAPKAGDWAEQLLVVFRVSIAHWGSLLFTGMTYKRLSLFNVVLLALTAGMCGPCKADQKMWQCFFCFFWTLTSLRGGQQIADHTHTLYWKCKTRRGAVSIRSFLDNKGEKILRQLLLWKSAVATISWFTTVCNSSARAGNIWASCAMLYNLNKLNPDNDIFIWRTGARWLQIQIRLPEKMNFLTQACTSFLWELTSHLTDRHLSGLWWGQI